MHLTAGRLDAAEQGFRAVISAKPDFTEAQYNLATVLFQRGKFRQAVYAFESATKLDPSLAAARTGLGVVLTRTQDYKRAESELRTAIAIDPTEALAYRFLGDLLRTTGRLQEARTAYGEALRRSPVDAEARFGIAFVRLAAGEMPQAWDDYECRKSKVTSPALSPAWKGENLSGKTLLVHGEQGLGDSIQFLRYVPLLSAQGATVLLALPHSIMRLAASVEGANVVQPTSNLPRFDYSCPLPSLPRMFRTTLATVPAATPYLRADGQRIERWRERLGQTHDRTIAIAWRGNPDHPDDHRRSIGTADMLPLLKIPGIRFLIVHKDDSDVAESPQIARLGECSLDDVAAVMSLADLTISVDTVFCHLAGALGRPVWTLLAMSPDWRWQTTSETSPWYPTMRLFRQQTLNDWASVIRCVATELSTCLRQAEVGPSSVARVLS